MAAEAPEDNGDNENVASSEHAFFEEKDEMMGLLRDTIASESASERELEVAVERVAKVLEKYQEQSTLLDPHLEGMMEILTTKARAIMFVLYEKHRGRDGDGFPFQCVKDPQQQAVFQVVYNLCRCRGYKTIVKFYPHEVSDLEPLMCMLQSQDRNDHERWESRYALLLWLSMLVLVPFDIYTIDSSVGDGAEAARYGTAGDSGLGVGTEGGQQQTLVGSILAICQEYMTDSGPTRDAAAVCLSSLLTRPDMDESYFLEFVAWAGALLSQEGIFQTSQKVFLVTGFLMTLTQIFKKGHRSHLLGVIEHLFPHILHLARQGSPSTLLRKLIVKLCQRIGMAFMPPRVVSWAYQRGQRSLLQNLSEVSSGSGGGGGDKGGDAAAVALESDEDVYVPDELEDIVEQLLVGLRDRDTVVRWSAAKGVGRITSRLPKDLADDVVASVFELFSDSEGDGAWHGGCLALAELARRGLLLPFRLPEAVPIVAKAIQYDVRRGSNSVGAHVRDAACYVCWAFARAYSPAVMGPFVDQLCEGMLMASLFDREINCRRAAAAAFQENVGRQGHQNFPHGIAILTAADYFTLGVRANAYLKIATFVAGFEKYRRALMKHVYEVKLFHWDIAIRALSARTVFRMAALDPEWVVTQAVPALLPLTTSPDLLRRHGSILGVAESVAALTALGRHLPDETVAEIVAVVPQIEKARLYRGRGGEIVRQAACRLIECIALAELPLPVKMQVRLLDSIDESIKHAMEPVQVQAVAALRAFARVYFPVLDNAPSPRLQARIVDKYVEVVTSADIASSTRGFSLALGALPAKLLAFSPANLEKVMAVLTSASRPSFKVGDEPDAETRRNALVGLGELCETVGVGGAAGLTEAHVRGVFETLVAATQDYSVDKRGDVGSWSRVTAMEGLEKLALRAFAATAAAAQADRADPLVPDEAARRAFLDAPPPAAADAADAAATPPPAAAPGVFFTAAMTERLVCTVVKQLCEKLDNVRARAGTILERILRAGPVKFPMVPERAALEALILPREGEPANNWAVAATTFRKMVATMELLPYHTAVISGLVLSVGGLTEAVVKCSSSALLDWARASKDHGASLEAFAAVLTSLLDAHAGDDRVVLPLLKTVELVLESEVLDFLSTNDDGPNFGAGLMARVNRELARSTNISKLFTGLNCALALLHVPTAAVRYGAMQLVLELLGHRYPRVRKHAAEMFYTKLLVDERLVAPEVYDLVLDLLSQTVWDADMVAVRQERDAIAAAVEVTLARQPTAGVAKKAKPKEDILDSYQNLINEVGY